MDDQILSTMTSEAVEQVDERQDAMSLTPDMYGPFWEYVNDDNITDCDYNGTDLWITDVDGRRTNVPDHGITDHFVLSFSQRVANKVSKAFNKMNPLLEAETSTLRISVLHETAAVSGRTICLRKSLPNVRINAASILETNYMPREILNLLVNCIQAKMNFVIGGEPGAGKRLANSTLVPVPVSSKFPTGWARHGDLVIGDEVFAIDGSVVDIDYITEEVDLDLYEVEFADGQVVEADAEHLWNVSSQRARRFRNQRTIKRGVVDAKFAAEQKRLHDLATELAPVAMGSTVEVLAELIGTKSQNVSRVMRHAGVPFTKIPGRGGPRAYAADEAIMAWADRLADNREAEATRARMPALETLTTSQLAETLMAEGRVNWAVPVAEAIAGPVADLPVDPYALGYWLGNGSKAGGQVTTHSDDAQWVSDQYRAAGYQVSAVKVTAENRSEFNVNGFAADLCAAGVLGNKHVPAAYLRASYEQRLALVQGLLDADGHIDEKGRVEFTQSADVDANRGILVSTLELVRSLGIKVGEPTESDTNYTRTTGELARRLRIYFTPSQQVFRLPRKAARISTELRETQVWNYIVDIRKAPAKKGKCIRINHPRHLYLVEGFIPTHNTELAKFLTQFIPEDQRVITIEDSPEWHFKEINPGHDCVEMRVSKEFDYSAAIKTCLRQNPKWIALSEARGEEAKHLITSWSTGVNGVTTIHTDDIRKIPTRLVAMMNNRNDAERMISDIYDFVNVAILVRRKSMPDGTSKRYVDQVGFLYRDGKTEDVAVLVSNGELVSQELPHDIRFRLERANMDHPFESPAIDAALGADFGDPFAVRPTDYASQVIAATPAPSRLAPVLPKAGVSAPQPVVPVIRSSSERRTASAASVPPVVRRTAPGGRVAPRSRALPISSTVKGQS